MHQNEKLFRLLSANKWTHFRQKLSKKKCVDLSARAKGFNYPEKIGRRITGGIYKTIIGSRRKEFA